MKSKLKNFIASKDRASFDDFCKKAFETCTKQTCELNLLRNGEPVIYTRIEGIAAEESQSKDKRCRIAVMDITQRKQAEEELKKYSERLKVIVEERTRQLQQAVRLAALGEMATMIGHDLRNPLQVIISMIYLAREMLTSANIPPLEGRLGFAEILDDIEKSSIYMSRIISDLQSYAGPLNFELARTDIHQLISDVLSILEIPKDVGVSIEVEHGLSEITIDADKIKRVIVNLINNSIQSMPNGGQIKITVIRKEESVVMTIRDEGVGIPDENFPKLFLPLFTTKAKGIGLGLTICRRLVEAHKGNIVIISNVNEGTEVTIEIPQDGKT